MRTQKSEVRVNGGVGFFGLLAVLFIGLKLTGYITWPWVWVLAPIWGPAVFAIGFIIVFVLCAMIFNK